MIWSTGWLMKAFIQAGCPSFMYFFSFSPMVFRGTRRVMLPVVVLMVWITLCGDPLRCRFRLRHRGFAVWNRYPKNWARSVAGGVMTVFFWFRSSFWSLVRKTYIL